MRETTGGYSVQPAADIAIDSRVADFMIAFSEPSFAGWLAGRVRTGDLLRSCPHFEGSIFALAGATGLLMERHGSALPLTAYLA